MTEGPVFYGDSGAGVVGVGHASFVRRTGNSGGVGDGGKREGEDWLVYHGMQLGKDGRGEGWRGRRIMAQRFGWGEEGRPGFPRPGYGPYAVPSGEV